MFSLRSAGHSEIGLVRQNNQDSAYLSPTLMVVADGMGGAAGGDLASSIAIERIATFDGSFAGDDMLADLSDALVAANDDLAEAVAENHSLDGMGTTVCGALFSGTQLGIVHIGDSRGYLSRDGKLTQLTHDHSWVQSLIDKGRLTVAEAATHPNRSLLLKVLNGQANHSPDLFLRDVELGDRILFCSDGMSGLVDRADIERVLAAPDIDLEAAVDELVSLARAGGGHDNITVLLSEVVEQNTALDTAAPRYLGAVTEFDPELVGHQITAPHSDEKLVDADTLPEAHTGGRKRRRPWLPLLIVLGGLLALVGGGYFGGRAYLSSKFFLGANAEHIAIYQGVPESILGIELNRVSETSSFKVSDLPPYYAHQVNNHVLRPDSLLAARNTLGELETKAEACIEQRAQGEPGSGDSNDPEACA